VSAWRRCDTCRKVRPASDFDGESTTCRDCLAPAPARRRTATVTRTATTPRPRPPLPQGAVGAVGSGDLEVRERRARRSAAESLAAAHPQEHAQLLQQARAAEGLRATGEPPPRQEPPAPTG